MPLTVANPNRPRRAPAAFPSRSSSSSSCISTSASTSADTHVHPHSHDTSPPVAPHNTDRLSLRSFVSASEATAFSDHPTLTKALGYPDASSPTKGVVRIQSENVTYKGEKPLPLPRRSRSGDHVDKHAVQYEEPLHIGHSFTTTTQLAGALGPDNAPHTTEIASVPCAGVRIPHGPLTGLLAWRLVVRDPRPGSAPANARRSSWWVKRPKIHMGGSDDAARLVRLAHAYSYSETMPPPKLKDLDSADGSTASLPTRHSGLYSPSPRPQSATSLFANPTATTYPQRASNDAVAANFILDTSLPYTLIARDTLRALGYASPHVHAYADDSEGEEDMEENEEGRVVEVEVTIQGVQTRARVARAGEAGRLGVQFLRDAGVSVFFPKDGEGVGPVLYYESSRTLRDVPLTIAALPSLHRERAERWKPTLPQRVRAFLGLAVTS